MKINTNTLLINLLLAGLSEKMLNNKYAGLPKSWKIKQALSMALLPDPAIGMMLHQNELIKEDEKIMQLNQEKTDEGIQIIKEFLVDGAIDEGIRKDYYDDIQEVLKPDISYTEAPIPFANVEEIPLFPNCDENASDDEKRTCFEEHIRDHIKDYGYEPDNYPENDEDISVSVMFTIDEYGTTTNVKAQGQYERMEKEIEELIEELPQIISGKHQGKAVRVICNISIEFYMEEYGVYEFSSVQLID